MANIIHIAAACIVDPLHRLLVVRKKGTQIFMQPGGKIEPGEQPLDSLIREIKEELQLDIPRHLPKVIGCFDAPAANEPNHIVKAELFKIDLPYSPKLIPTAEIAEALWLTYADIDKIHIAPLMHTYVLPLWQVS